MTIEELKTEQTKIEGAIENAQSELNKQKALLRITKIAIYEATTGFKHMDDLVFDDRIKGQVRCVLTGFYTKYGDCQPIVNLYKKDGTIGTRTAMYGLHNLRKA